jgi:thiamine pyrophosphokinase
MPDRALVFAGGDALPASVRTVLPSDALVIAADSGVDHALALGRHVDVAVGDFDSVTPEGLRRVAAEGARVERHAPDKDATDLELALHAAVAAGASQVSVVGGHGGRLDHLLGNLALLASPRFVALTLDAWLGTARVTVVRGDASIVGAPGSLVSLFAMHGPACGVTTRGLRFPLHDADLEPGSTLGISNELVGPDAGVTVADGVLLAIQPDALPADDGGP